METLCIVTLILQILGWSANATDYYQTDYWIDYTAESPLVIGEIAIYERNPILFGKRWIMDDYFARLQDTVTLAPKMLDPPFDTIYLGVFTIGQIANVANNNRISKRLGLPKYWVFEYRFNFN